MTITRGEAREVARATVHEVFSTLGVDLADQDSVNEFRKDLMYGRKQRMTAEEFGRFIRNAGVVVVVTGIAWALWHGIKAALGQ